MSPTANESRTSNNAPHLYTRVRVYWVYWVRARILERGGGWLNTCANFLIILSSIDSARIASQKSTLARTETLKQCVSNEMCDLPSSILNGCERDWHKIRLLTITVLWHVFTNHRVTSIFKIFWNNSDSWSAEIDATTCQGRYSPCRLSSRIIVMISLLDRDIMPILVTCKHC